MRSLWFRKPGSEVGYYRCGNCGLDHRAADGGFHVMVGPTVLAIVCSPCTANARAAVAAAFPHAFPDVDERGVLLDP